MSFINKTSTTFINAKLTDIGRKLLSSGQLNYSFYVFGDSEIDYKFATGTDYLKKNNMVLSPKDNNPNVKYPVVSILSGSPFNTLPQISSVESKVKNVAKTRGFFVTTGTTVQILPSPFTSAGNVRFRLDNFTGTNTLTLSNGTTTGIKVGDYLFMGVRNPNVTVPSQIDNQINPSETVPHLWYKVMNKTSNSVTLDRPTANFSYVGEEYVIGYVYPYASGNSINNYYGSATTIPYWYAPTLSFESTCSLANDEVKLWNMNIVFTENLAGLTSSKQGYDKYTSGIYNGFKEYVNSTSLAPAQKALGIIHYTNNSISNYYGESLVDNTLVLNLPSILYSEDTSGKMGLVLSAKTGTTNTITSSVSASESPFQLKYNNLVDKFGNTVGKVFTDLKTISIEDEEILAAMSYKSNRNWTLPKLVGNFVASQSGEANGLLTTVEQAHVTYLLANDSGQGYTTPLHCMKYTIVNRGGTNQNNVLVKFPVGKLPFMNNTGWQANKLYLLVQKTTGGARPTPGAWKQIDVTSSIRNYTSGNINYLDLENSEFLIDLAKYNAGADYVLSNFIDLPAVADTGKLQFGEEMVFFGNVDTEIQSTVYKSSFTFSAPSSLFNSSVNPTFSNNGEIWISEVGIYDSLKRLVAVGKLSNPIRKKPSETALIQLDIDF